MISVCSKIVAPYDDSESSKKALAKAAALALADETIELRIITVVEPSPTVYFNLLELTAVREDRLQQARRTLDLAKETLNTLPNTIKTAVLQGEPSAVIVKYAEQENADLVVMGSRGLSGLKEWVLGSVSHSVVQKASCPVYIVK
ncbi:universal stress protein [Bacillus sp. FJAT-42376]|uniref:universal stress protein n=1 Tax=Bacillus sp. FJAT-42376 TaxID=2014076 RepID=UPI000F4EFF80|nr:universal stress protein [Bacillus sp. FJAT-42376]AZB42437.1 universal stress protein [Bacillus sp. FJAT-42376]